MRESLPNKLIETSFTLDVWQEDTERCIIVCVQGQPAIISERAVLGLAVSYNNNNNVGPGSDNYINGSLNLHYQEADRSVLVGFILN